MTERFLTNRATDEERGQENVLRPRTLDEYVGQDKLKESLRICIETAKQREEALDHAIFYGPPGLGKTTIAHIIAREMGATLRSTSGLVLAHAGDLAAILTNLQEHGFNNVNAVLVNGVRFFIHFKHLFIFACDSGAPLAFQFTKSCTCDA